MILLGVAAYCLCRKGFCLKWCSGPRVYQQLGLPMGNSMLAPTGNNIPTSQQLQPGFSQAATAPPTTDHVSIEIENLKSANELLELQQRRSQLLVKQELPGTITPSPPNTRWSAWHDPWMPLFQLPTQLELIWNQLGNAIYCR